MSKLGIRFLAWTFAIMALTWGVCAVCSMNGIFLADNVFLYVPYILGGYSPTIASFIALKQTGQSKSFLDWLKGIFDFKHKPVIYLVIIALSVVTLVVECLISGYEQTMPLYFIFMQIPAMIFGGGMEELGWRHILQPEVEKKFNFTISTIIVSVIWWFWHLPLFYISGLWQYGRSFAIFGISITGISFALAAIKKKTGSTWLCVLFHGCTNAWATIYLVNDNITGTLSASVALIVISFILVKIGSKDKLQA